MQIFRQGDVGLVRVASVPVKTTAIPRDNGRIVLAYGEVTGHAHAILDEAVELVREMDTNDRFLRIMNSGGATLTHEEHATVMLPPGDYRVIQQVEYVPKELPRAVLD